MTPPSVVDLVTREGAGYRDLYYRWEHEQWEAGRIDLGTDATTWGDLDPFGRRHLADAINWRRVRAELATTALVPFVDAGPTEEQQVFLTTQLADEARAGVFLDRVADEVLGATEPDMAARSGSASETVHPTLRSLMERALPEAAARLRAASDPVADLARAVASYHLGLVGVFGLTELQALLEGPAAEEGLGGLAEGLMMIQRDATRHVAFGLLFLSESDAPYAASPLEAGLNKTVPGALAALAAAGSAAPGLGGGEELQQRAREDLAAWLRAVGLRVPLSPEG